jgi:hypothetical protein
MRHDEFAERAARCLEEIAAPLEEEDRRAGRGITAVRANELRVAAHVVRDLSAAVRREEERGSSVRRLPLEVPSSDPGALLPAAPAPEAGRREVRACP